MEATSIEQATVNGSEPDEARVVDAAEARVIDDLRGLLADAKGDLARAQRELETARDKRDRYERAIIQLTREKRAKLDTGNQKPPSGKKDEWHISDEKVERIFNRIQELIDYGERFTASDIGNQTPGMSPESVRKALVILRGREQVRRVGTGRGGSKLFTLMPIEGGG